MLRLLPGLLGALCVVGGVAMLLGLPYALLVGGGFLLLADWRLP